MSHGHDPKQKIADWWRGDTPINELEKALDALPPGNPDVVKSAILDAIYEAQSVQKTERRWTAVTRVMSSLFLLLIAIALGFIGWSIWQIQSILAGMNKASSSQLMQMQMQSNALADQLKAVQLKQDQAESTLESLATRAAAAEAVQPTIAAIATRQQQYYEEIQKALSATPTPSPTPTPTISATLTVTSSVTPSPTPAASATANPGVDKSGLSGSAGTYKGRAVPRMGLGVDRSGTGIYERSPSTTPKVGTSVTICAQVARLMLSVWRASFYMAIRDRSFRVHHALHILLLHQCYT